MSEYCRISLNALRGDETHPGYRDADYKRLFGTLNVEPELPFTRAEFFRQGAKASRGLSISGVQEKLSLGIENGHLIPVETGGLYILKPSPEAFPSAAENEHAAMTASRLVGIDTAQCGLFPFKDGELAYLCKRFDRDGNGVRYPQEDVLQAAGLPSDTKYAFSYEEAGAFILEATKGKPASVLEMIKRLIFAYLIGNNDLHLKNLSLKRTSGDVHYSHYDALTPNYDVLFCSAIEAAESSEFFAIDFFADDEEPEMFQYLGYYSLSDFVELGKRLSIPARPIERFAHSIRAKEGEIVSLIQRSYMPSSMKTKAVELVLDRMNGLRYYEKGV